MSWIEPISTTVKAASLANQLMSSSSSIQKYAARFRYWINHGNAVIPVFGAGGVGKSTAARLLTGANPLDMAAPYDESWVIEPVALTGNFPGKLLVAPGQAARVDRHWPELMGEVVAGTSFGVINVVAYGYHSLAINSFKEHDVFTAGMNEQTFMSHYVQVRLKIEIEMLKKLFTGFSAVANPLWMVTLVTKQDLWWSKADEVRRHYEKGPYGKLVKKFLSSMGKASFQHEFLPASLALGNLQTPSGEELAKTTAGYDMKLHLRYLQSMFSRIDALIAQGAP
jgi:hypothetical protein